ncbi:MAG TPA: hypothetical protein P5291_05620 [Flavobacteriales bacterium]|nr:hypothetical protein [Flavobacteriales bacterium]
MSRVYVLPVAGSGQQAGHVARHAAYCLLPAACCPLPATCCLLPIARYNINIR